MELSDEILKERLRILYEQSPNRPALHFISGAFIFLAAMPDVPVWILITWICFLYVINFIRINELIRFQANPSITDDNISSLWKHFRFFVAITGMVYGFGAFIFSFYLTEANYLCVLLIIATCIPAALVSFLSDRKSFILFISFTLFPIIIQKISLFEMKGFVFAVFTMIYFFVLIRLFNWQFNVLIDTISLKISHYQLLQRVEKSNVELEKLSSTDALTGLYNRRVFDIKIEHELLRAIRTGAALSLIMVDIDKFKEFNDEFGHLAGDECLAKIATLLNQRVIRTGDFIARYGGEEFVIILPATDKEGAINFATDLQQYVFSLSIPHAANVQSEFVTISMGIATFSPEKSMELKVFIDNADKAMYQAKSLGRNTVAHFDDMP